MSEEVSVNSGQKAEDREQKTGEREEETVSSQQSAVSREERKTGEASKATAKPLRPDGHLPLAGEELLTSTPEPSSSLRDVPKLDASATLKTQGVKEARGGGGRAVLEKAARRAARTASRTDVQEYMRVRRNYV